MFDTRPALADMATQIRSCRADDSLTLQQLAVLSGVAASTIHKVESRQMVPTVSVLLKIAKGLGRRPQELIRDEFAAATFNSQFNSQSNSQSNPEPGSESEPGSVPDAHHDTGVWQLDITQDHAFPGLKLESLQHAILLVERGVIDLRTGDRCLSMSAGDCIEIEGGRSIETLGDQKSPVKLTLIVSPTGNLEDSLGAASAILPSTPSPASTPARSSEHPAA